jgi:ketosteroid isomerase-like protein
LGSEYHCERAADQYRGLRAQHPLEVAGAGAVLASTGAGFEARFAHLWTLADGRVSAMRGLVDTGAVQAAFHPQSQG